MFQFDTHKVYKKFKDAGIEDRAADAFVEAINEARATDLENLATKQDLKDIRNELDTKIESVRAELKVDIADVKSELKDDIHLLELKVSDIKSELVKEVSIVREGVFEAKLQAAKFHSELREDIKELKSSLKLVYVLGTVISTGLFGLLSAVAVKIFLG